MPTISSIRAVLIVLLAGCSAAPPETERPPAAGGEPLEYPNGAATWRLERYLDENDEVPERAWQIAQEAREATEAATEQLLDTGGISPLAWTQRGPNNVAGRTRSIAIDPNNTQRIWVGAVSGGLWKSEDRGQTWSLIDDWWRNLSVGCVALDPQDSNVIYVGTGEGFYSLAHLARSVSHFVRGAGVLKSVDGGATWTQLPGTASWQHTTRIAISPSDSNLLLASRRPGGIARSTDGGQTWSDVTGGIVTDPFSWQVLFDPNDGSRAVAHLAPGSVANHSVITSQDAGQTWQLAASGLTSVSGESSRIEMCYAPSTPNMVYASTGAFGGKVFRSTDAGVNWTQRTQSGTNLGFIYYYNSIWVDPTDHDRVVVGARLLQRSTDGGQTFSRISSGYIMTADPHPDVHAIVHDPNFDGGSNRRVYVATDGGIHFTDDITTVGSRNGWSDLDTTMRSTQFYAAAGHHTGDMLVGGTQDNGTLRIRGTSPTANLVRGGDGGQVQIDPTNPQYVYGETQWLGVHRSTNGGQSAGPILSGLGDANRNRANFISPLRLDPNDPQRLYAGGLSLWRTDDARGAATWNNIKPDVGSLIASIAITPGVPGRVFVGHNDGRVYRTDDATATSPTWTAIDDNAGADPLPDRVVTRLIVDPTDSMVVYACFGGFAPDNLWRSADAGATWSAITGTAPTSLPPAPIYGMAVHPDDGQTIYSATEVGVFASDDAGAHWSTSNDGPANVVCEEISFMHGAGPRRLVLATLGRGLWTATVRRPSATTFGTACAGHASPPALGVDPLAPASLGNTLTFRGTNLQPSPRGAWLALGVSNQNWAGGSLPFPLDGIGMAGCSLQVSIQTSLLSPIANGEASWDLPLPASAQLLGQHLYAQIFAEDTGANAMGLVVSRPVEVTAGW